MAAIAAVSVPADRILLAVGSPMSPGYWCFLSVALCSGFLVSYPIRWWLVARGLKHGTKTIAPARSTNPGGFVRGSTDIGNHDIGLSAAPVWGVPYLTDHGHRVEFPCLGSRSGPCRVDRQSPRSVTRARPHNG